MTTGPTREQFRDWAQTHTIVPIWRELVADLTTPVAAFARCVRNEPGFILESVEHGERWSRFSFVGRRPRATLRSAGNTVTIDGELGVDVPTDQGMLGAVEALLQAYRSPTIEGLSPMHGGLVGYLGYDVVREIEKLPDVPEDQLGLPDATLMVVGQIAAFDHWRQRVMLIDNVVVHDAMSDAELDAAYDQALERIDQFAADGASQLDEPLLVPPDRNDPLPEVTSTMSGGDFQRAVEASKELIRSGDIFQVVLSQRFDFELDADPFDVYRVLRQINPSPYMFFVRTAEVSLVGASPEPLVKIEDGRVISRPIAGTRRRGQTDVEDRALGAELIEDPKERAEHVMLVDLARNDIGRVIDYGSLEIDDLMILEYYSHVMHLTSQVSGVLRDGLGPVDVIRATLPAGTLSGAPKVRAMQIIDDIEPAKRGPYGGVVGYLDFNGNLDTAIAIRTMVITTPDEGPNRASIQAGAGVVYDSDPESEHNECYHKASALLAAVTAAERLSADRRVAEGPDAETFLQGQLSQDVTALAPGEEARSLVLHPQGKISAWFRITRVADDRFGLDLDSGWADEVLTRLNRFKLRTKIEITLADWHCLTIIGPGADDVVVDGFEHDMISSWAGVPVRDVFGPTLDAASLGLDEIDAATFTALRIEAGVPRMGSELDESTIPAAAGIVDQSVSFTKGCYTGQELVARIDSRGNNVPKRLLSVVLQGQAVPAAGAELLVEGEAVGTITSASFSSHLGAPVCLAYVKRSAEVGQVGTVEVDGGAAAGELRELALIRG